MRIRHAEPEDAEEIRCIALNSWKDTYEHILSEDTISEVIADWYDLEICEIRQIICFSTWLKRRKK